MAKKKENPSALTAIEKGSKELLDKYAAFYTKKGYVEGFKKGIRTRAVVLVAAAGVGAVAGIAAGYALGKLLTKKAPEKAAPQAEPTSEDENTEE